MSSKRKPQPKSGWKPFVLTEPAPKSAEFVASLPDIHRKVYEDEQRLYDEGKQTMWQNHLYVVIAKTDDNGFTWLSIRRQDRKAIRDWRHFQRIKNELCGPEREAIELFPAESRLVDGANQYHLWVFPEGQHVPIGWEVDRMVTGADEAAAIGAVQRDLEEE
jgi:hypothetical protein